MKRILTSPIVLTIFTLVLIVALSSCGKRRELKQLGCVRGKIGYAYPDHFVGPMTKKAFFAYLDSPTFYFNGTLINFDMRWDKIDKPEACPVGI